jgi:hypothetical protein
MKWHNDKGNSVYPCSSKARNFFLPPRLEILINLINHGIINFNCGFKLSCQKVGQKMTRIPPPAFSITGNKSQLRRTDIRSVLSLLLATSHKWTAFLQKKVLQYLPWSLSMWIYTHIYIVLPSFHYIRCFSFVKQMYLDIF